MTTSSHSHARGAGTGARTKDEAAVLAASAHLTDRDRELVRLVGEHRVLTTDQVAALAFGSVITARHRLAVLVRLGVLRRFRPQCETGSAPWHYVLGPIGAALLGVEDRDEKKWAPHVRADRHLSLERSQRLGHMTGVNWFFVALRKYQREGGGELRAWYSERETAEYLYQRSWDAEHEPHPDGLGIWAEDGRDICFLLEYDTSSEHLPQLAGKLSGYSASARTSMALQVPILFCFPTPRREQSARRALARASGSQNLQIATAALDPRTTCPAEPVWMTLHGGHGPMRLIGLDDVLPDPWRAARAEDERRERERQEQERREQAARQFAYEADDPIWPYGR